jgi:hypothetical protein
MKNFILFTALLLGFPFASVTHAEIKADVIPPVVIKTFPEAGADNIPPGNVEIRVTFSKPMKEGCATIAPVNRRIVPEIISPARLEPDGITYVLAVKLRPNTTYGLWVNGPKSGYFQDLNGIYALPYQFVFKTKAR